MFFMDKNVLISTANLPQCYHGYNKLTGTHFYTRVKEGQGPPPGLEQRTASSEEQCANRKSNALFLAETSFPSKRQNCKMGELLTFSLKLLYAQLYDPLIRRCLGSSSNFPFLSWDMEIAR